MPKSHPGETPLSCAPVGAESSVELLSRVRNGDDEALGRLLARYLVPLRRWAHGRLPGWARTMSDTQDLVHDAVVRVLGHLATFQPERPGALHAYLRTAVSNRILDELRQVHRRPSATQPDEGLESPLPSPHDAAVKKEDRTMFEAALSELRDDDRELVIARIEWDLSYAQIAAALGKPTPAAARVAVRRAVLRLADIMKRHRTPGGN
jgi:RNA polymerase sigma-70 factor, ECF subfamily